MIHLGRVKPGSTIEFSFGSFAGSTGAPSATTNFAAADVQVYKDGGTTQRASASGITVTADFDSQTGVNYISIDLSDNTTADFWAAGSRYTVVIADVTIDGQTVRFPVGTFRIGMEGALHDTTIATLSSQTSFTLAAGSADDGAYVGWLAYVHDAASAVQCCLGVVSAYTGSTKTITLAADPGVFTMAAKDNISLMPPTLMPTVRGRTLDVSSGGEAGVDWANVGGATTTVTLSGTTVKTATDVETDTADIQSRLPAALVSGRIDASVGAMASNVVTAAAIAADAITAAKIADGAIDAATFASGALDAVWSTAARTLTALDEDNTTIDLDATIRSAVGLASANLDTQLTAIDDYLDTEVAAIKATTDKLDGMVEQTTDGYIFKTTAVAQVWDETLAAHLTAGSTGQALNAAGAAGDPWTTALPGAYSAGQAGYIVGTNLNATVSSRATQTSVDTVDDFLDTEIAAIKAKTDNLPASPAATDDIPTAAAVADAVWDEAVSGHVSAGTFGKALDDTDDRGSRTVIRGTVTSGASTTSIPTSAFSPAGAAADQFKGRIVIFDNDTATAALRGQATDITASSNSSTPTLTVTALTTTPASGDTFSVV